MADGIPVIEAGFEMPFRCPLTRRLALMGCARVRLKVALYYTTLARTDERTASFAEGSSYVRKLDGTSTFCLVIVAVIDFASHRWQ